ncbi:MAG: hypothetical protein LBW85_05235 [Deltaproteobacteria bacterium]|nr:hypothetical protein [Deltaproteobacteria bacterium]
MQATAVFEAKGRKLLEPGWRSLTPADQAQDEKRDPELDNPVPELSPGQELDPSRREVRARRTSAPPRYTQAALVRELERRGIGRPSTYASIMDTISGRGYVTENPRRQLAATGTGETLVNLMEGRFGFLEYGFTKGLEERLDGIAAGRLEYLPVVEAAWRTLQGELSGFRKARAGAGEAIPCPRCGEALSRMLRRPGPDGPGWNYWRCRNPSCGASYDDGGGAPDPATARASVIAGFTCPVCGSPLRHLSREGGRAAGGYNFWRCSKDDCMTTFDDSGGKPDYSTQAGSAGSDLQCPECGAQVRHLTKAASSGSKGYNYWKCASDACGSAWDDRDGEPDWSARRTAASTDVPCPRCGSRLRRHVKEPSEGSLEAWNYWACPDRSCRSFFPDAEGKPDPDIRYGSPPVSGVMCPCCGEPLKHVERKGDGAAPGWNYWRCLSEECGAAFDDRDGAPDPGTLRVSRLSGIPCPICSSPLKRNTREAGPDGQGGYDFWACSDRACGSRWEDRGGKPDFAGRAAKLTLAKPGGDGAASPGAGGASGGSGSASGDGGSPPGEGKSPSGEGPSPVCPACGSRLTRLKKEGSYDYWKCASPVCGSFFEDRDGAPDPARRRTSVLSAIPCPACGDGTLRHLTKDPAPDGSPGWNYWACASKKCKASFADNGGAPDFSAPFPGGKKAFAEGTCPACGKAASLIRKEGAAPAESWAFWLCASPECASAFDDLDGAPDPATRRISLVSDVKCPSCGSLIRHNVKADGPKGPGWNYWACPDRACGRRFDDLGGAPDLQSPGTLRSGGADVSGDGEGGGAGAGASPPARACPSCGGPIRHLSGSAQGQGDSYDYWKCQDPTCGASFDDRNGSPDPATRRVSVLTSVPCPNCENPLRHNFKDPDEDGLGGWNFWSCPAEGCRKRYNDRDGAPDRDSPFLGVPDAGHVCPACQGPVRHVKKASPDGASRSWDYWKCLNPACGSFFEDSDGSPDPATRRISAESSEHTCPDCGKPLRHNVKAPGPDGTGGWDFWACSDRLCGRRFNDGGGAPDLEARFLGGGLPDPVHVCPACQGPIRHLKREAADGRDGYDYWKCQDPACGSSFNDRGGAPDPSTRRVSVESSHLCPDCQNPLRHSVKAPGPDGSGGWDFWSCGNRNCGRRFNDRGGEPDLEGRFMGGGLADPEQVCPACRGPIRHLRRDGEGPRGSWNYWRCADPACGSSFDDRDGAPDPQTRRVSVETLEACPRCGRPLRHNVKAPGPDGTGGWDFWACSDRSCGARFNDRDGSPDLEGTYTGGGDQTDVPCPACNTLLRHLVKNGASAADSWNYWRCPDPECGSAYDDREGAPDPATRRRTLDSEYECQACGRRLRHHLREPGPDGRGGYDFWACPDRSCGTRYRSAGASPDFDSPPLGAFGDLTDVPCPNCGKELRHLERQGSSASDSWNYWKCPDPECGSAYDDLEGAPDPSTRRVTLESDYKCPQCGGSMRRHIRQPDIEGKGGWDFWSCAERSCRARFSDQDGQPDFSRPGGGGPLTDVPCPSCGAPLRHLERAGAPSESYNYWRCSSEECGSAYDDDGGKPDPASRRVSVLTDRGCPTCGAPLRRNFRPAAEGREARTYWSCSDRSCRTFLEDKGGEPDPDSLRRPGLPSGRPCPQCGADLIHMERAASEGREGYNYWKCPGEGCGSFFDDAGGEPDPATLRRTVVTSLKCPKCGGFLEHKTRPDSAAGRGWNYWICSSRSCRASFNDDGGSPGPERGKTASVLTEHLCSDCGKPLRHIVKEGEGGFNFWGCSGFPACRTTYPDVDGRPGPKNLPRDQPSGHKCIRCGGDLYRRKGTSSRTGLDYDFFSCANPNCRTTYNAQDGLPAFPNAARQGARPASPEGGKPRP